MTVEDHRCGRLPPAHDAAGHATPALSGTPPNPHSRQSLPRHRGRRFRPCSTSRCVCPARVRLRAGLASVADCIPGSRTGRRLPAVRASCDQKATADPLPERQHPPRPMRAAEWHPYETTAPLSVRDLRDLRQGGKHAGLVVGSHDCHQQSLIVNGITPAAEDRRCPRRSTGTKTTSAPCAASARSVSRMAGCSVVTLTIRAAAEDPRREQGPGGQGC